MVTWKTFISWRGRTYLPQPNAKVTPGDLVVNASCNLPEINRRTRAVVPTPYPDGSFAGHLKTGDPIHAVVGADPRCQLTAKVDGVWLLYRAC